VNPEDFKRILRSAGLRISTTGSPMVGVEVISWYLRDVEALIIAVRKEERERCAQKCAAVVKPFGHSFGHWSHAGKVCAEAIRALRDEQ